MSTDEYPIIFLRQMVYIYNYEHVHHNNPEQITGLNLTIEGLRAKRAYIGFWPIFIFLLDRANFSQTDLF